jgi:hypothetical protein
MHGKLNLTVIAGMLVALAVVSVASGTSAGPLDPPAGPTNTNAYTLDQLWNRLSAGVAGTPSAFTEPTNGPGTSTMHTLDEIMAAAPAVDDTNGASATEVVSGKKFWGLTTVGWGVKTGTAALGSNVSGANGSRSFAIPDGFYTGKTATAQDPALTAGNIRQGAVIFGVAGASKQASGNAGVGDVLLSKTFSNDGGAGTGTMPNNGALTLTPGTAAQTIPAGYHNGLGKVVGDAALTAGNIRQGVAIFGVAGSSIQASGTAVAGEVLSGKTFSNTSGPATGSMPNNGVVTLTPGTTDQTIPAGYHSGSGKVVGDPALTAGNIRQGASIFGVVGSSIQASGAAVAGEVLSGKTFSNASGAATGGMPNNGAVTLTPGTADVAIVAGYHNGSGKVLGDADLAAGNIRQGANIFGVTGAYRGWTCTGTLTPEKRWCDNGNGTIRDLTTGLIWLKMANWGGQSGQRPFWADTSNTPNAQDFAALLYAGASNANLSDGSVVGDWRLPTLTELKTLTSGTEPVSSVNPRGFTGIGSAYWSSTAENNFSTFLAWYVNPASPPVVALYYKTITMGVWPVRDGQ